MCRENRTSILECRPNSLLLFARFPDLSGTLNREVSVVFFIAHFKPFTV